MTSTPPPTGDNRTVYRVALDATSASRLVDYVAKQGDALTPGEPPDLELVPSYLEPVDTVALGQQTGTDREDAVGRLLEHGPMTGAGASDLAVKRAEYASKAAHDGIPLTFVVTALAYVGEVPVALDRRLKIG